MERRSYASAGRDRLMVAAAPAHNDTAGRRLPRLAATSVAAIVTLAAFAAVAAGSATSIAAHAILQEIVPAEGAIVDQPPGEVTLTFNEPVSLAGGRAEVLDDSGSIVSTGATVTDAVVSIDLPAALDDGTYVVRWQVISADTHPVGGTSVFHVDEPSAEAADLLAQVESGSAAGPWLHLIVAALYATTLVAAGMWWFARLIGRLPRGEPSTARVHRLIVQLAIAGVVAAAVSMPLRIAWLGDGFSARRDGDFVSDLLTGPAGWALAVTVTGLILVVAGRRSLVADVGSVMAVAGFVIDGHTRTQDPTWAMIGFDVLHLVAAAAWFGGLVGIVLILRHESDHERSAVAVTRFSRLATVIVSVLAATGLGMAVIVLPELSALWRTGYGGALATKVLLVAVALALGARNRRRVASLSAGDASAAARDRRAVLRRLSAVVRVEVAVLVGVAVATSVLVASSPLPSSEASPAEADDGPTAAEVELSDDSGQALLELTPGTIGRNELWIILTDPDGQPLSPYEPPTAELRERAQDLGPMRTEVHDLGDGTTYHAFADVPIAGQWEVLVRVRLDEFTSVAATATFGISG